MLRQLNREEHPDVDEIVRRYKTDKELQLRTYFSKTVTKK